MLSRRMAAGLMILTCLFLGGCCSCTKEECMEDYGLVDPADCETGIPEPSTPIIILESRSDDNYLTWQVDAVKQTNSNVSLFTTACKQRFDFIGRKVLQFKYLPEGTNPVWTDAETIYAKSGTVKVTIQRNDPSGLVWQVDDESTPLLECPYLPNGPLTPGVVVSELFNLDPKRITHWDGQNSVKVVEVKIQTCYGTGCNAL